jgi:FkbM family methyltransferase
MKLTDQEREIATTTIDGWVWPAKDRNCWDWLQTEKDLPELISNLCSEKSVVIEAGGNAGFYVKKYSEIFDTVYTFEPDNLNFYCLSQNVREKNVIKIQSCLGDARKTVSLSSSKKNTGAYSVDTDVNGIIPTLLIDDLHLEKCDLIHLDIEGFELFALKGAIETIKRTKPLIALEWMNHGDKFDASDNKIEEFLETLGYKSIKKIYHENIFAYTS